MPLNLKTFQHLSHYQEELNPIKIKEEFIESDDTIKERTTHFIKKHTEENEIEYEPIELIHLDQDHIQITRFKTKRKDAYSYNVNHVFNPYLVIDPNKKTHPELLPFYHSNVEIDKFGEAFVTVILKDGHRAMFNENGELIEKVNIQ